jgi:hypothetical protein
MKPANSTRRPETRTIIEEKNKHNTAKNLKGLTRKSIFEHTVKYINLCSIACVRPHENLGNLELLGNDSFFYLNQISDSPIV